LGLKIIASAAGRQVYIHTYIREQNTTFYEHKYQRDPGFSVLF
jgi:hypothetical protein